MTSPLNGPTPESLVVTTKVEQSPSMYEQSRSQVYVTGATPNRAVGVNSPFLEALLKNTADGTCKWYKKVRMMRRHPTISDSRQLIVSVQAESEWSVEADEDAPEGAKEFVEKQILPLHDDVMGTVLSGEYDFGWIAFEKVFSFNMEECRIEISKLKPLLHDQTEIVVRQSTGAFAGVKQFQLLLTPTNCLLFNREVEGTYWYGEGKMPSCEIPYNRWLVTDAANVRYDHKVSGSHWIVHYPVGKNKYLGQERDNADIANAILNALEGSGSVCVPNDVQALQSNLNEQSGDTAWKIELLGADPSAQMGFQQRLGYLDTLMVRAGGLPERSILEGQYGTKAEAQEHSDFGVSGMDRQNKQIVQQLNKGLVDQLLALNFGPKAVGKVRIKIAPIADDKITMLKQVYMALLSSPASNEVGNIDLQAIRDQVGVPTISPEQQMQQQQMFGGPDYSQGMGHGGSDPMLRQFLANLNAPESTGQQVPQQGIGSKI